MITIIHGDDTARSRKYYIEERQKVSYPIIFEGKNLILTDLVQIFEGGALFSNEKTIFIEELLSVRKGKELEDILAYLEKNNENEIFIWEGKDLSRVKISLKNAVFKPFNFPKEIFAFLDSIKPQNQSQILLLHNVLKTTEPEIVFAMIIRQFRLLLALSDLASHLKGVGINNESLKTREGNFDQIDEVKRLAPWQMSKLKRQANMFTFEQLKTIYHKLFEIDLAQKTGTNNSLSLTQSIDFFLLEL